MPQHRSRQSHLSFRRTLAVILPRTLLALVAVVACAKKDDFADAARGRRLSAAVLTAPIQAAINRAAVSEAFTIEPSLILMLDTTYLPRTAGLAGGKPIPQPVRAAMRNSGLIQGTCQLSTTDDRHTPICETNAPGYIVRFSEIFRIAPDTVQVHLLSVRYQTPTSPPAQSLRFEKAYRIVGSGGKWRAVSAGRISSIDLRR